MDYLQSARSSLFRFEARQTYDVSSEKESFFEFLQTGKVDISTNQAWYVFLDQKTRENVHLERIRLIARPLSAYLRFELPYHVESQKHGDNIRIIEELQFQRLYIPTQDFWLIDNEQVLLLDYDERGKWSGFHKESNVEIYRSYKQKLVEHSDHFSPDSLEGFGPGN